MCIFFFESCKLHLELKIPVFISLFITFTFTSSIEIESINSLRIDVRLSAWYIKLQFVPAQQVSNIYKD